MRTAQIKGQRLETLTNRTVAIMIESMALCTICQVDSFSSGNNCRFRQIYWDNQIDAGGYTVYSLSAADRNNAVLHYQDGILIRTDRRRFSHAAVAEIVIVVHQGIVCHQHNDNDSDDEPKYFLHLFNTLKRDNF